MDITFKFLIESIMRSERFLRLYISVYVLYVCAQKKAISINIIIEYVNLKMYFLFLLFPPYIKKCIYIKEQISMYEVTEVNGQNADAPLRFL